MLKYTETPVIELENELFKSSELKILAKREDLNHPYVSGNKWWKLKYNLEEAQRLGQHTLLTFGGAFSNHIYATAAACKELGLKSIGIIRGEKVLPLNPTLSFARSCGMELHFISREAYRQKTTGGFREQLHQHFGDFYLIPEGGTNAFAISGCAEFAREKIQAIECTHVCLPIGTGGTLAGIVAGLQGGAKVIGFSVLKNGSFLKEEIKSQLGFFMGSNWEIQTGYHFGGYAKQTPELNQFIWQVKQHHNLPLDPVYTGKMMFGVFDLLKKNFFPKGSTVLILHTGGLQATH